MNEKSYKVIEMVLNGSTFKAAGEKIGFKGNCTRQTFQIWIEKANPDLYRAGLRPVSSGHNYLTPPISYLRAHKEEFLKGLRSLPINNNQAKTTKEPRKATTP